MIDGGTIKRIISLNPKHNSSVDRFLTILERFATVAERWADREYPHAETITEEAYISKRGETEEPQSKEAYQELPEAEGRFEKKYRESHTQG